MKGLDLNELKFQMSLKTINSDINRIKEDINENLDVYFIDDNKEVYDTMMKDYTGGKHKTFESIDQTDFVKYNDYKNSFLDRFKK